MRTKGSVKAVEGVDQGLSITSGSLAVVRQAWAERVATENRETTELVVTRDVVDHEITYRIDSTEYFYLYFSMVYTFIFLLFNLCTHGV